MTLNFRRLMFVACILEPVPEPFEFFLVFVIFTPAFFNSLTLHMDHVAVLCGKAQIATTRQRR
jgi:hypothetical protein